VMEKKSENDFVDRETFDTFGCIKEYDDEIYEKGKGRIT